MKKRKRKFLFDQDGNVRFLDECQDLKTKLRTKSNQLSIKYGEKWKGN